MARTKSYFLWTGSDEVFGRIKDAADCYADIISIDVDDNLHVDIASIGPKSDWVGESFVVKIGGTLIITASEHGIGITNG